MAPVTRYVKGMGQGIHRLVRSVELSTVSASGPATRRLFDRAAQNPATGVLELNQTCAGKGARDPFLRNDVPARVEQSGFPLARLIWRSMRLNA